MLLLSFKSAKISSLACTLKLFKLEDEIASSSDKDVLESLQKTIASLNEVLDADDLISLDTTDENNNSASISAVHQTSLKSSCPTRWNFILYMVSLIVQLKDQVQNLLKQIEHAKLWLHCD